MIHSLTSHSTFPPEYRQIMALLFAPMVKSFQKSPIAGFLTYLSFKCSVPLTCVISFPPFVLKSRLHLSGERQLITLY